MKTIHWLFTGITAVITFGIISMSYAHLNPAFDSFEEIEIEQVADTLKSHSVTLRGEGHGNEIIKDIMMNSVEDDNAEFIEDALSSNSVTLRGEGHGSEIISNTMMNSHADMEDALSSTSVTLRGEGHGSEIISDTIMNQSGQEYPAPPHKIKD